MTLIDVELSQEPLVIKKFSTLQVDQYPYCLIGFQLKNSYDQKRIQIKPKYGAKDIMHLSSDSKPVPLFFRGIELSIKNTYEPLIDRLKHYNTSLSDYIKTDSYMALLSEYNLTCDDCYAYLKKGVYPVDGKCLERLTNTDLSLERLYDDAFNTRQIPAFQAFSSFTIFILRNETIFRT